MNNNWRKLSKYLKRCNKEQVTLTFEEIETITGAKLPKEALRVEWWWNRPSGEMAKYWLSKGYKTFHVKNTIDKKKLLYTPLEGIQDSQKRKDIEQYLSIHPELNKCWNLYLILKLF